MMNEEVNRFVNEVNNGNSQEAIRLLYSLQRRRTPMKLSLKAEMSSGCKGNKLEMIKELIEVYKIEIGMAKWAVSKSSSVEEALNSKAPLVITILHLVISQLLSYYYEPLRTLSLNAFIYWNLLVITLSFYYQVAYRNPGFIEPPPDEIIAKENNIEVTITKNKEQARVYHKYLSTENWEIENELRKQGSTASEAYAEIVPDVEEVVVFETRYCTVCCVEQPLRAKHCRECGKCVALHDHHCPWLGLCIGEKNRFFFWWYLFFENLLLWISEVLMGISFTDAVGWDWVIENWGKIPIIIIVSFFTFMVTCLIAYHSYLAIVNQTTWENVSWEKISYLKNSEKKRGSPFSKGIRFNLWFYCWKKYPENYTLWTVPKLAIT